MKIIFSCLDNCPYLSGLPGAYLCKKQNKKIDRPTVIPTWCHYKEYDPNEILMKESC